MFLCIFFVVGAVSSSGFGVSAALASSEVFGFSLLLFPGIAECHWFSPLRVWFLPGTPSVRQAFPHPAGGLLITASIPLLVIGRVKRLISGLEGWLCE